MEAVVVEAVVGDFGVVVVIAVVVVVVVNDDVVVVVVVVVVRVGLVALAEKHVHSMFYNLVKIIRLHQNEIKHASHPVQCLFLSSKSSLSGSNICI